MPDLLCDPFDSSLTYTVGAPVPDWMAGKMAEQGYDPADASDLSTFESVYLIAAPAPAIGTQLAVQALDGQWISREARLATLEAEADSARTVYVAAHCRYGDILLEYRDLCASEGERFSAFLDRQGLAPRRAYELIRVAQGVRQFPALKDLAARQYSKALALIDGMPGEDLTRLLDGQMDIALDDVDRMPVRELKATVRRLTADKDKVVEAETKLLRSEKEALEQDLKTARAALDGDLATTRKTARALRESTMGLSDLADSLLDQLAALDPRDMERLKPELESCITGATLRLKDLWETTQERLMALDLDD